MRFLHVTVEGFEVELELSQVSRLEPIHFQLESDEAAQPAVVEEQVEEKVLVADLEAVALPDEREVAAEFEQELPEVCDQRPL